MWIHRTTFRMFALALGVLGMAHMLALYFLLYWTYLWLDIPLHALGGAVVALGFLAYFHTYTQGTFRKGLMLTLGTVLAVGVLWELFELFVGAVVASDPNYFADTMLDLIMDGVGGSIGYMCARWGMYL